LATADDPLGTFIAKADEPSESLQQLADEEQAGQVLDPVARAWEQGWKDVFNRLEPTQQTLLFEILHAAEGHAALDPAHQEPAAALLPAAASLWEDYQAAAFQSVAQLKGDDQARWIDVLRQVNRRFSNEVQPALQAIVDGRAPTEAEEQSLQALRQTMADLALARIEDDTIFRPAEREIWFYELARVRDTLPADLQQQSVGEVAYLQLFKQPNDYRGEVVTLRGTVKLAYRVQAPQNYLGIEQYYVYWIHAAGGPNSPIVVYALAAPPGFPEIKDKDLDAATTKLHEDVTVSGVFFKRWAYLGKDGTYTAPLIIASRPEWTPRAELRAGAADFLTTPLGLAAVVGVAFVLAALFVTGLLLFARPSQGRTLAGQEAAAVGFDNLQPGPTTQDALRQMERDARSGKLQG
jgi:hypothetical protein